MIGKFVPSIAEAMDGIADGAAVLVGGFGPVGQSRALLEGLVEQGATGLVMVSGLTLAMLQERTGATLTMRAGAGPTMRQS